MRILLDKWNLNAVAFYVAGIFMEWGAVDKEMFVWVKQMRYINSGIFEELEYYVLEDIRTRI